MSMSVHMYVYLYVSLSLSLSLSPSPSHTHATPPPLVMHLLQVPKAHRNTATKADASAIKAALVQAQAGLRGKSLGSTEDIALTVKANVLKLPEVPLSAAAEGAAGGPTLAAHMKRPFWLPTDTDHLGDILSTVFSQTRKDP